MPPPRLRGIHGLHETRSAAGGPGNVEPYFSAQRTSWKSPDDILSILMIIGGDIVQRAVAQLAGSGPGPFAPVAFSFGWLAYSVSALTAAVGDGRLLPPPDMDASVVNARTGYVRENASWVLARLLRDHEKRTPERGALTVAFYHTRPNCAAQAGVPARDWVYWSGVLVILAQLVIAAIPGALSGNWIPLVVTAGGTALALTASGLPQWREEKYAARTVDPQTGREVVCLTRGNGSTFAMVVISDGAGIRLEDLAGGRDKRSTVTAVMSAVLCVLWVVLLLTVEGLQGDAWYLLAVGGLGMVQNVIAAGAKRSADALGFHFESVTKGDVVQDERKVMRTLMNAEEKETGVGLAMLPLFFPGELRPDEKMYWEQKRAEKTAREEAEKRRKAGGALEEKVPEAALARPAHPTTSDPETAQDRGIESHDEGSKDVASSEAGIASAPSASISSRPSTGRANSSATLVDGSR